MKKHDFDINASLREYPDSRERRTVLKLTEQEQKTIKKLIRRAGIWMTIEEIAIALIGILVMLFGIFFVFSIYQSIY